MKLGKVSSVFVQSLLFLFSFHVFAAPSGNSQFIPYYGDEFYNHQIMAFQDMGTPKADFKAILNKVLTKFHITQTNKPDRIVDTCDSKAGECYKHILYSYSKARTFLLGRLHLTQKSNGDFAIKSVYCERQYDSDDFPGGKGPGPDRIPNPSIMNTEHTWPQSKFSRKYPKDLQKSDLHILYPVGSSVNTTRSNLEFAEVDNIEIKPCDGAYRGKVNGESGTYFEPPDSHKGNVARALFYFSVTYEMPISKVQEKFLRKWHVEDPVDADEITRNEKIFAIQKTRNPFIDFPELVNEISDF